MVEMQETANILHGATSRSLVVLDEIGRGTATFDGLSIAWAVAEYLATNPRGRPKTLFATHYHELTDLADALPGVVNCHVAAREWQDDIIFLHKIVPGRSDRSYGIQVARLAGHAGVGHRARARDPPGARTRRAGARRPPVDQRHAGRTRSSSSASSRCASDRSGRRAAGARLRTSTRSPDAARGALAARRAEEGLGRSGSSSVRGFIGRGGRRSLTANRTSRTLRASRPRESREPNELDEPDEPFLALLAFLLSTTRRSRRDSVAIPGLRTTSIRDTAPTTYSARAHSCSSTTCSELGRAHPRRAGAGDVGHGRLPTTYRISCATACRSTTATS